MGRTGPGRRHCWCPHAAMMVCGGYGARDRREAIRRIDLLIAAPGQGRGKAGVTHLLLMVGFKPLAFSLALSQYIV